MREVKKIFTPKGSLHNTYYLIPNTQRGFAIIPLVILLLFGIAAGTLLVQNRTNFLPKAQQNDTDCYLSSTRNFQGETVEYIAYGTSGYVCNSNNQALIYSCGSKGLGSGEQSRFNPICRAVAQGQKGSESCQGNVAIHTDGSRTDCGSNGLVCIVGNGARGDADKTMYAQANTSQVLGLATQNTPNYAYCSGTYCEKDNRYAENGGKYIESCKYNQRCEYRQYAGVNPNTDPFIWSTGTTVCSDIKPPAGNIIECGFKDIDDGKATFSHCDFQYTPNATSSDLAFCRATSRQTHDFSKFKIWCTGGQSTPVQPAVQPAASKPKIQAKKCENTPPEGSIGCYFGPDGEKKFMFPPEFGIKCDPIQETQWCQRVRSREGCETVDAILVENNTEKPVQYTQCTPAKTTAPTQGAPTSGGPPAPGARTGPTAGATGAQPRPAPEAAPLICGKDKDGLDIPCYSIGVFTKEELTSREAQAKIASVNYSSFRQILDNEAKEIDDKIKENAKAKIAAAEKAIAACVQK